MEWVNHIFCNQHLRSFPLGPIFPLVFRKLRLRLNFYIFYGANKTIYPKEQSPDRYGRFPI